MRPWRKTLNPEPDRVKNPERRHTDEDDPCRAAPERRTRPREAKQEPRAYKERRHQQRHLKDHDGVQVWPRGDRTYQRVRQNTLNCPTHKDTRSISAREVQRAGEQVCDVEKLSGLVNQIRPAPCEWLRGHDLRERVLDCDPTQRDDKRAPAKCPLPKVRLRARMTAQQRGE